MTPTRLEVIDKIYDTANKVGILEARVDYHIEDQKELRENQKDIVRALSDIKRYLWLSRMLFKIFGFLLATGLFVTGKLSFSDLTTIPKILKDL